MTESDDAGSTAPEARELGVSLFAHMTLYPSAGSIVTFKVTLKGPPQVGDFIRLTKEHQGHRAYRVTQIVFDFDASMNYGVYNVIAQGLTRAEFESLPSSAEDTVQ